MKVTLTLLLLLLLTKVHAQQFGVPISADQALDASHIKMDMADAPITTK